MPCKLVLLLTAGLLAAPAALASDRPNFVVILADDLGFSDIGAYGSEIPTPNLDALASEGLRFRQFYNTGRCCPTRASLLTGLYSHQAGIGHMTADQGLPGYRGRLHSHCATVAESLSAAGYFTAMVGKWHVGHAEGGRPTDRGFDRALNLAAGGVYFPAGQPQKSLFLDGEAIADTDPRLPKDWYSTDLWTDFGLKYIDEALAAKKPFFLYQAQVAPHFPLQATAEDIAAFRGRYRAGWDALAAARLDRQKKSGLVDPSWSPNPRPEEVAAWDSLSEEDKDRFDHLMATYAAVVARMDRAIGHLVQGLRDRHALDNTVILFLSDNGGNYESGPRGRSEGDPTTAASNWFCGQSWAHLQNTPLRLYKHYNHEGGVSSPLVVHWPKQIKTSRWVDEPAHVIDIAPTLLSLAEANPLAERDGEPTTPLAGQSLAPLLTGDGTLIRRQLFWEHEGNAAVREGDLKLVRRGTRGAWELYDLAADRAEQHNLATERPTDVQRLVAAWKTWAEASDVLPKPVAQKNQRRNRRRAAS